MTTEHIPEKLYFKIGEVSELAKVKPYVLRYWETEFSDIEPVKSRTGQRLYKRKDVELILRIKELLYKERFTINGARKRLKEDSKSKKTEETQAQPTLNLGNDEFVRVFGELKMSLSSNLKTLLAEMHSMLE